MNEMHNKALMDFSRVWQIDGDLIRCCECGRALIASRDGEDLRHRSGCRYAKRTSPWKELRTIIGVEVIRTKAKPITISEEG